MSLDRRVGALEARPSPPAPARTAAPTSTFETARLSFAEQVELDDLLRPLAPLPGEVWELDPLTVAQLERAHALVAKGHGWGEEGG